MNEESYSFTAIHGHFLYQFESTGENKKIQKTVVFTQTENKAMFNLALLDQTENGKFSDQVESNNGDLVTVLSTVFRIVEHFLAENPQCLVMFRGHEKRRHRLYRIVLSREFASLSSKFRVYGGAPDNFVPFKPNTDYDFYFIKQY
jgi:hypothetical protein